MGVIMKSILLKALAFTIIFMIGFFTSSIYASMNTQQPAAIIQNSNNPERQFTTTNIQNTDEVQSPNDWVSENQIKVYNAQIILDIKNAQWATFTDTHSMEPVLSSRANAIEIVPQTAEEIKIGDIVSYQSEYADGTIIHRVIAKGVDEQGVYFTMKGDNNNRADPGKIRFSQIKRVVVAIVY